MNFDLLTPKVEGFMRLLLDHLRQFASKLVHNSILVTDKDWPGRDTITCKSKLFESVYMKMKIL